MTIEEYQRSGPFHPVDEAVSIAFDKLKEFAEQLRMIDQIKRVRM
jgi:hypothetical protein